MNKPMKKIGEGLQYEVFEIENTNRVRKIPISNLVVAHKIKVWLKRDLKTQDKDKVPTFDEKFNFTIDERHNSFFHIKQLVEKYPQLNKELGNPTFFDNYEIEQDKVLIFAEFLNNPKIKFSVQCTLIDKYIQSVLESWKYGFSDRVFNFTENIGVDSNMNIILLDFGEIVYEKEKVKHLIEIKRWENSWSFREDFFLKEVIEYYTHQMSEKLTLEQLERYWGIYLQ